MHCRSDEFHSLAWMVYSPPSALIEPWASHVVVAARAVVAGSTPTGTNTAVAPTSAATASRRSCAPDMDKPFERRAGWRASTEVVEALPEIDRNLGHTGL